MNRCCIFVITLLLTFHTSAKEIAFTFDDAPRSATGYFDGPTRASKLITELKQHGIEQATFFAVTDKLNTEGKKRLKLYSEAGHLIANHSHSHLDINRASLDTFVKEIDQAHALLDDYPTFIKWFRFPYLREGNTLEKRDGVRTHLKKLGYFNAYITLNNYDWYLENLFQNALQQGKKIDFEKLKELYIDVIIQGIEYYDALAVTHLSRSPKHVLLLHEMDITALFVGDLADALRAKKWRVISAKQAYQDNISEYLTNRVMKFNPGRIGEIAKDKGQNKQLWHFTLEESYLKKRFDNEVLIH